MFGSKEHTTKLLLFSFFGFIFVLFFFKFKYHALLPRGSQDAVRQARWQAASLYGRPLAQRRELGLAWETLLVEVA